MRVLFINTVCGRSSTGGIIRDISKLLIAEGHDVMCLYGRYSAPDFLKTYRIGNDFDVYCHALQTRIFDTQGFGSRYATKKAIREIEEYNPDIIHLHNLHGNYLNIEILFEYLKHCGKPVIWTLHDCWAYTGHCTHYIYNKCTKWMTETCSNCPRKADYPASYIFDRSSRNFSEKKEIFSGVGKLTITTVSEWLKSEARKSFLNQYPIMRIYNGVDLDIFNPKPSRIKETLGTSTKIVLCITDGWSNRKGLQTIYEAEKIRKEKNLSFVFLMVGVQKQLYSTIPDGIIALPRTDSIEELVEIYSGADVMWNPSPVETFSLVNIESLACGTPVVTMNTTACPETVDETCGRIIIADNHSAEQAIEAIQELFKKPPTINACLDKAKQFSKEKSYSEYIKLYQQQHENYVTR